MVISHNFGGLVGNIRAQARTLQVSAKRKAFSFMSAVIYDTPVDTGLARNNWIASWNLPDLSTNEADPSGTTAIKILIAKIQEPVKDVLYLTNNLPYIQRLEYEAWSSQAPDGMVRKNAHLLE